MSMYNKGDWKFPFTDIEVLHAANEKVNHHAARLTFWTGKQAEVTEQIKDGGIQIEDSISDVLSNASRYRGPQVSVREDLQADLLECHEKVKEHTRMLECYQGWAALLGRGTSKTLDLTYDDWAFFFGQS